jgi:gluconolactonase
MTRRHLLTIVLLMMTFNTPATAQDGSFEQIVPPDAKVEKLATGFKFIEGPVWIADVAVGYLVFSDIPNNQLNKWDGKAVTTFRNPSNNTNGNTRDRDGRLISCEHGARRVSITEKDGTVRTLVDRHEGKRFNSPNDAVVKSDGTVWFTDPPYGVPKGEQRELDTQNVFRFDPKAGKTTIVAGDMEMPNGLCFSPDETKLYVAESFWKTPKILVFDVSADGATVTNGRTIREFDNKTEGVPDGMRCDADGRLWSSAKDGVHVMAADGKLLGKIRTPETVTNLCFGGTDGQTLFMTGTTSLYSIKVNARAVK